MTSAGTTRGPTLLGIVLALALPAVLMACGSVEPSASSGRTSAETDREALIALYNATDGPNWTYDENWLTDAPLGEWYGVETDNGRVTRLDLNSGSNWMSGEIPPELGRLANLEWLALFANQLSGEIPARLGGLANLEWLALFATS